MQVNILESKNKLSSLVRRALRGEDVVIANRGVPVVKLVPIHQPATPVAERDFMAWLQAHPLPATAARTHEEIESELAAERNAWD